MDERPADITMQLEGKVIGPWVNEFDQVWRRLADSLALKRFCVDLREVTQMDAKGKLILAEIYEKTGADFLANTPIAKYLADEARRGHRENEKEKR